MKEHRFLRLCLQVPTFSEDDDDRLMAQDTGLITLVSGLMDRGLSADKIDFALRKIVGDDWRDLPIAAWLWRLQVGGYLQADIEELSMDVLEPLIIGCIKLEDSAWLNH